MNSLHHRLRKLPTSVAGLALGIASLGLCLENSLPLHGIGQLSGAIIAATLLLLVGTRFVLHPDTLLADLKHPVTGSIVPTFAMALMVVSKAAGNEHALTGQWLWLFAVIFHLMALMMFVVHRCNQWSLSHMVPAWFVPPVGIIVADVTLPGAAWQPFALLLLCIGMLSYLLLLPVMIYRLMFRPEVTEAAKPTIAIMAAPASLSLAGYLNVVQAPSLLICALLLGVALLMTLVIYCAFFRLLRLPFSPGFAAYTFPMAVGATALYKVSALLEQHPLTTCYARQIALLANIEAVIACLVIGYVVFCFIHHYLFRPFSQTGRAINSH